MKLIPYKALGPTFIFNIILQNLAIIISLLLQCVLNASLELSFCTRLF